jgi:hypothetical protein
MEFSKQNVIQNRLLASFLKSLDVSVNIFLV